MSIKKIQLLIGVFLLAICMFSCNEADPNDQFSTLEPNPASDFEYSINSNQSGVLIEKYVGNRQDVVIPSHIDGLPVLSLTGVPDEHYPTATDEGVFEGSSIKSVVIPETVKAIGFGAFADCVELTSVSFAPDSQLETVGESAFYNCAKLEKVDFSETSLRRIRAYAFRNCTALEEVKLADTLEDIEERAFYRCSSLSELDLPQSLTKIEVGAFGYCTSIRRIVIPADLDLHFFEESCFHGMSSSVEIEFTEGRETLTGYALIQTRADVRIIVPKGVKEFSPLPFLITPTAKVELVFYGDAPAIVEEKDPDWFGTVTVYYDAATNGWDSFEWKNKFEMISLSQN